MELIRRYIVVPGIKFDGEVIPIWDDRLEYQKDEYFGKRMVNKKTHEYRGDYVEMVYDLKTRTTSLGEVVDSYPEEDKLEFKKGESVYYEAEHRKLKESVVEDILFEEYDTDIMRGKKMDKYYKKDIPQGIKPEYLYVIKRWKPSYILEDGTKIEWDYKLYHKA